MIYLNKLFNHTTVEWGLPTFSSLAKISQCCPLTPIIGTVYLHVATEYTSGSLHVATGISVLTPASSWYEHFVFLPTRAWRMTKDVQIAMWRPLLYYCWNQETRCPLNGVEGDEVFWLKGIHLPIYLKLKQKHILMCVLNSWLWRHVAALEV